MGCLSVATCVVVQSPCLAWTTDRRHCESEREEGRVSRQCGSGSGSVWRPSAGKMSPAHAGTVFETRNVFLFSTTARPPRYLYDGGYLFDGSHTPRYVHVADSCGVLESASVHPTLTLTLGLTLTLTPTLRVRNGD